MTVREIEARKRARQRINARVYRGTIPPAKSLLCIRCGAVWKQGSRPHVYHHPNGYDGDNAVVVEPLCTGCHLKEHGNDLTQDVFLKVRSVRLDDDVWDAVKAMECSLNQYLRTVLLDGAGPAPGLVASKGFQRGVERGKELRERFETGRNMPEVRERPFRAPLLKPSEKGKK